MLPAKRSQTRKVVAGLGLSAALVVVTLLLFFAPDLARLAQPSIKLVALMDDAGALQTESPVWVAGREVGSVMSVAFRGAQTDSTERVAVTMRIPRKYAAQIRRDSQARITSRRLIGEPVIDIAPGSVSAPPIRNLDSLRIRPRGTLIALLDKADALNESFELLFADMRAARVPTKQRARQVEKIDQRLSASMAGMRDLVNGLSRSPMRMLSDPAWQRKLDNLSAQSRELNSQFRAAAQRARAAHNDARPSLERLAVRADTIAAVLSDVKTRIAESGGGLLIRAQRDSAIVKGLHEAQVQLDSLMAEAKRNPLRFWF